MNVDKTNAILIILGAILIILTLVIDIAAISLVINHIIEDLTVDLFVHLFIAGTVLLIIGLIKIFLRKDTKVLKRTKKDRKNSK